MAIPQKNGGRNSILELLRLCASLWVLYYHNFSLINRTQAFSNGRIAVDFFFILSGFFFFSSYHKENDKTTRKGLLSFVWKKFKPLSVTFGICMIFSVIYYIEFFEGIFVSIIWGYLWYVPHLLFVMASYFFLRRFFQNNKVFYSVTILLSMFCYYLILTYAVDYGLCRGFAGVGLGILISKIPKMHIKKTNLIAGIATCILFASITTIAVLYPIREYEDPICLLVLFPSIIYFASNIRFSNVVINKICSINFGLYAYQAVTRLLREKAILTVGWQLFLIVLLLAVIDVALKSLIKRKKICPKRAVETSTVRKA